MARRARLVEAHEAAARGDWEQALNAVRSAWRHGKPTRLVALCWSLLVDRVRPSPVQHVGERETERLWVERAARSALSDLPVLAATPWPRLTSAAKARVEALAQMPADALLGGLYGAFVRRAQVRSLAEGAIIRRALRQLLAQNDPFCFVLVDELGAQQSSPDLGALVRAVRPVEVELEPDEEELVEAIEQLTRVARPDLNGLYQAVYDEPTSDAPRAVLADALVELGDARGEFIALQLQGRDSRVERTLVREHGRAWLGELEPFIEAAEPADVFHRGFVSKVRLRRGVTGAVFGQTRAWGTVEEVTLREGFVFEWHPNLRALRSLVGLDATRGAPFDVEEVWVAQHVPLDALPLRSLKTLALVGTQGLDGLTALRRSVPDLPWWASVECLVLQGPRDLASVRRILDELPTLREVVITARAASIGGYDQHWELSWSRERVARLVWHGRNWGHPPPQTIAEAFSPEQLSAVRRLEVVDRSRLPSDDRRRVREAFERLIERVPTLEVDWFGTRL